MILHNDNNTRNYIEENGGFIITAERTDELYNLNIPRQISVNDYLDALDEKTGFADELINLIKGEFRLRFFQDKSTELIEQEAGGVTVFNVTVNETIVGQLLVERQGEREDLELERDIPSNRNTVAKAKEIEPSSRNPFDIWNGKENEPIEPEEEDEFELD